MIDLIGENFIDILKAKDIGQGGLSVYVPYQFAGCIIDKEIEVVVTLPDTRSFKTSGMIRHKGQKQGFYFGIAFTHIEGEDLETLKSYIKIRADNRKLKMPVQAATHIRHHSALFILIFLMISINFIKLLVK
jgi:hypothetical protein